MRKDALQQDLPAPDEAYTRRHCLYQTGGGSRSSNDKGIFFGFLYSTENYCEGGPELEPRRRDVALPVLASERRAATLTPGRVPQRCLYITVLVYLGTEWLEAWLMDNEIRL
jgi:hypothetical protein